MESFDLHNVNLDILRRKCCFISGQEITYQNEYDTSQKKKVFKSCVDLGDILPIKLKQKPPQNHQLIEEIKEATLLLPNKSEESK